MEKRVCERCKQEIPDEYGHAFIIDKCYCMTCLVKFWTSPQDPKFILEPKKEG
jgi:late competence protein required for DNA uptake (superfamily II DNA/RNA helicase)